ncbi:hypothetical protein ACIODS_11990 [Micromonospora chalcea]|uniref:hypothetical protein n=1 Tax=Micromonospora chalcea TaxID=1874 RepID=UPI0037F4880D
MADRRLPYARTLAVLHVLSWPYRHPPLSWLVKAVDWVSATRTRLTVHSVVCLSILIGALILHD